MTHQYLDYNGIMVPVSKYIELKAKEKKGEKPLLETIVKPEPVKTEKIIEVKEKGDVKPVLETKWEPGLPTKSDLRVILDERNVTWNKNNCRSTLYKLYVETN